MLRNIFEHAYVPTICVRPFEMRALEELPTHDKDRMFPLVLLAPWVGARTLDKSIERIKKAYGDRAYFLGLDHDYNARDPSRESAIQFASLLEPHNGFSAYFDFIEEFPQCIPVVNVGAGTIQCLERQIQHAEKIGRGFLFSITNHNTPIELERFKLIDTIAHDDFAFHLDHGWAIDPLTDELWYQKYCQNIFEIRSRAAVVISSCNFPRDFSHFEGIESIEIGPRRLFKNISQRFNNSEIIYGDWASTKPRSYLIASAPLPRIDYPLRDSWIIARNKPEEWDYQEAAQELINSEFWHDEVNVWGTYMIRMTAEGLPFSIGSFQAAGAARINIHLHIQANHAEPNLDLNTDDPWED